MLAVPFDSVLEFEVELRRDLERPASRARSSKSKPLPTVASFLRSRVVAERRLLVHVHGRRSARRRPAWRAGSRNRLARSSSQSDCGLERGGRRKAVGRDSRLTSACRPLPDRRLMAGARPMSWGGVAQPARARRTQSRAASALHDFFPSAGRRQAGDRVDQPHRALRRDLVEDGAGLAGIELGQHGGGRRVVERGQLRGRSLGPHVRIDADDGCPWPASSPRRAGPARPCTRPAWPRGRRSRCLICPSSSASFLVCQAKRASAAAAAMFWQYFCASLIGAGPADCGAALATSARADLQGDRLGPASTARRSRAPEPRR